MDYTQILKELRKEDTSLRSRLQSILYDARYVATFADFPLVANERCGSWYVDPAHLADLVYFKLTDGHTGEWKFSHRRLNLHLVALVATHKTVVVVDLTRKGKLMPDALLKTVPMWCAVLNYVLFGPQCPEGCSEFRELVKDNWLKTPRAMVSESEHQLMVALVPEHAREVVRLGLVSKESLEARMGTAKPLLPFWAVHGRKSESLAESASCYSVYCVSASVPQRPETPTPKHWPYAVPYVQGAADDHELWATDELKALDPLTFWNKVYREALVVDQATGDLLPGLSNEELTRLISAVLADKPPGSAPEIIAVPLGSTGILIGKITSSLPALALTTPTLVFSETHMVEESALHHNYKIESSKKGLKKLREVLPDIMTHVPSGPVLLLCDTGIDISVGVALCILCRQFDKDWVRVAEPVHVNKDVIKHHLSRILDCVRANPSRNTLQSVNTFLMSR